MFTDSSEEMYRLRQECEHEEDFEQAETVDSYGSYGDFQLVGHGKQTKDSCGRFRRIKGCIRVELHDLITLDETNYRGKGYFLKHHFTCHRPECPVCYKFGWVSREADRIEQRLKKAAKRFGMVEHLSASCPSKLFEECKTEKGYERVRKLCLVALKSRGIHGGCMIFHGFRFASLREAIDRDLPVGWRWSPHWHVLGFVKGGYSRCRGCRKAVQNCLECEGYEGRTRREFKRENERDGYGWIVEVAKDKFGVKGVRQSIRGTGSYQLDHATILRNSFRWHTVTWFGVCSYRQLKVVIVPRKKLCPICGHELEDLAYYGKKTFCRDRSLPLYKKEFYDDVLDEDGKAVWVVVERERFYGGDSGLESKQ